MDTEDKDRPHIDDIASIDMSESTKVTPETAEFLDKEHANDSPYIVVYRLSDPDGRVVCVDCYFSRNESKERVDRTYDPDFKPFGRMGDRDVGIASQPFTMFFPNNVVCNICEKIVTADDQHICMPLDEIIEYIKSVMAKDDVFPEDKLDGLTQLAFQQLAKQGVYTECPYHDNSVVVHPRKREEDE